MSLSDDITEPRGPVKISPSLFDSRNLQDSYNGLARLIRDHKPCPIELELGLLKQIFVIDEAPDELSLEDFLREIDEHDEAPLGKLNLNNRKIALSLFCKANSIKHTYSLSRELFWMAQDKTPREHYHFLMDEINKKIDNFLSVTNDMPDFIVLGIREYHTIMSGNPDPKGYQPYHDVEETGQVDEKNRPIRLFRKMRLYLNNYHEAVLIGKEFMSPRISLFRSSEEVSEMPVRQIRRINHRK